VIEIETLTPLFDQPIIDKQSRLNDHMAPRRSSRPNVTKSYKNSCGASAPRGIIQQPADTSSKISVPQPKKVKMTGGILTCTKFGEALDVGAVNCFYCLIIKSLLKW